MMRSFKRYFLALFLGSLFPVPVFAQTVTNGVSGQGGSKVEVEVKGRSGNAGSNIRTEFDGKLVLAHPNESFPVPRKPGDNILGGGQVCFITDGGIVFGADGEQNLDFAQVGVKLGIQTDKLRNSDFMRFEIYPYKAHFEGAPGQDKEYLNAAGARLSFVQELGDRSPLSVYFDGNVDYLYKTHSDVTIYQWVPPYGAQRIQTRTEGVNASLACGIVIGLGRDDMGDRRVSLKAGLTYQVADTKEKILSGGASGFGAVLLENNSRDRLMPTVGISINTAPKRKASRSVGGNR